MQITVFKGGALVSLPNTLLTLWETSYGSEEITQSPFPLSSAIKILCYGYLEQEHGGWENNDGAVREFCIHVEARKITLEFNERFTDTFLSSHSL